MRIANASESINTHTKSIVVLCSALSASDYCIAFQVHATTYKRRISVDQWATLGLKIAPQDTVVDQYVM